MSVSVTMPRLGESVSEGTVTRWLKKEGERVEADEPLLEVSTDKVDTEIPSPTAGVVQAIKVSEDETVEVGAELAVIDEGGTAGGAAEGGAQAGEGGAQADEGGGAEAAEGERGAPAEAAAPGASAERERPESTQQESETAQQEPEAASRAPEPARPAGQEGPAESTPEPDATPAATREPEPAPAVAGQSGPAQQQGEAAQQQGEAAQQQSAETQPGQPASGDGERVGGPAYVTPLVRKLAAERGVDLSAIQGTGVGGRIRKQDVLDATPSTTGNGRAAAPAPSTTQPAPSPQQAPESRDTAATEGREEIRETAPARPPTGQQAAPTAPQADRAAGLTHVRGRTEKLSRLRTVIAKRMTESLQVSAQLTTVVEADLTTIARLRDRAKRDFEQREGVRLSFLPFFAVATCEALKSHPAVNSSIDLAEGTVTYHDAVHLGIAVDTDRGLLVPVIHDAHDLNLAGLARKIADIAERTRNNAVSPDELGGGTFTLTNTGSRGALFDTPIINQPQVGILGTGAVVKRPAVVDTTEYGEIVAVRSQAYLALTYDHRIVDGADAARFLNSVKERLEEGAFEAELGL